MARRKKKGLTTKDYLLFGGIALFAYLLTKRGQPSSTTQSPMPSPNGGSTPTGGSTTYNLTNCSGVSVDQSKMLQIGVTGCEVVRLQSAMNVVMDSVGLSLVPLVVDGNFGQKTQTALVTLTGATKMTLYQWQNWVAALGI